nr:hypothetical protein [Tanacetum cinerariifolium]
MSKILVLIFLLSLILGQTQLSLEGVRNRLRTLTPSSDEMKEKWWKMSLEYFHNVSKAKVHREVDVCTNVHHDVDEGLSVPDVHHDFEEVLSVPEILKKIYDIQHDFQSRITVVEQFVNHHKDLGSLTKNPHNRVALMKKIVDMETSNVAAECMSVDKNPSCRSDVKARNKESMCVDSSVKTSCATDMNADNALEEPQLSGLNFIVEEHQQVLSKNYEIPIAGAEMIVVDSLMKIINFDIPKEVQQEAKASKYRVSPYMIHPESTQQNHKVRARIKKVKKRDLPLTAHDGKVIPDWKEVYFPINVEDNHWILVEFHIRSGVITFYDNLPSENLKIKNGGWTRGNCMQINFQSY